MNAIEFLKKAKVAEYRKEVAMEKLMRCKNTVERLTSILSRDRVTSTRDVTSHETAIIRYMESHEGAAKASVEYDEIVDKIEGLISQLDSATAQSILRLHYIEGKSMSEVSKEISMCRSRAYHYHTRAIQQLSNILDNTSR